MLNGNKNELKFKTFHVLKGTNPQHLHPKPTHGFSLVELLVVVAILAILAAIAIPLFLNQRSKAAQGAVQSDSRNLATNLNTLFANLPRSANPNVELNGDSNPNATLSGSGTIEVDGETLNVNLSPDVVITKTGNANPTDGAGLKITHAGVEGWACVIPLPFSVAYAQTVTFQPTCGTVVSETGNLLPWNVSTGGEDGDLSGTVKNGTGALFPSSSFKSEGLYSIGFTAERLGEGGPGFFTPNPFADVSPNTNYTAAADIYRVGVGSSPTRLQIQWRTSAGEYIKDDIFYISTDGEWFPASLTAQSPSNAGKARIAIAVDSTSLETGQTFYADKIGFWEGSGGGWEPSGVPIVQP